MTATLERARSGRDLEIGRWPLPRSVEQVVRRRIERDLHDGAQQRLVVVAMLLGRVEAALEGGSVETARRAVAEVGRQLELAINELQALARGLHPPILTERGLGPAISGLATNAPLPVEVRADPGRLPSMVEATGYFVVAEAVTNLIKHAHATVASIDVTVVDGVLVVDVADDGIGGADPACGSGLAGLAERVAAAGGCLQIDSPAGRGTRVRAEIPVAPSGLQGK